VGLSAAALERITTTLQSYVDSGKFPGFLALIARHGKVAYVASVGWMDVEHQRAMSPDAVFRIYSLTKPIASAAAMQLYERGKVRLEDPVSKYIPAFAGVKVYAGGGAATPVLRDPERPITLADLLTHASGLTYGFIGNTPADSIYRRANLYNPRWTLAQLSDSLAHLPLAFSPGTRWNYSYSIDVLARVVELVSGMTFDRYLDSMLFRPLGMSMTAFHVTPAMEAGLTNHAWTVEELVTLSGNNIKHASWRKVLCMKKHQHPRTLQEAGVFYANPDNSLDYMVGIRWPEGVVCPTCGRADVVFLTLKAHSIPAVAETIGSSLAEGACVVGAR